MNRIILGDNLEVMRDIQSQSVDLVCTDPPFNTHKVQKRSVIRTTRSSSGDRVGFQGERYKSEVVTESAFEDSFDDYLGWLHPRLLEVHRVLKPSGSLYLHLDQNEVHYVKVMLDEIFGRSNFMAEVIWGSEWGGKSKRKWPCKHNNILVYTKTPDYYFNLEAAGRVPYLAPDLVGSEKAAKGKLLTTFQWHTVVPTNGKEKQGYATQKPLGLYRRFVRASCPPGGLVLDPFAGSGTTGAAAGDHECAFILIDRSPQAMAVMKKRFENRPDVQFEEPLELNNGNGNDQTGESRA